MKYATFSALLVATAAAGDCDNTTVVFDDADCTNAVWTGETLANVGDWTDNTWDVEGETWEFSVNPSACAAGADGLVVNSEWEDENGAAESEEDVMTLDECLGPDEDGLYSITTLGLLSTPTPSGDDDEEDDEEEDAATKVYASLFVAAVAMTSAM